MGKNADLERERLNATFDVEKVTNLLDGSVELTRRRRQLEALVRLDPSGVFDNSRNLYLHRNERHVRAQAKTVRLIELCRMMRIGEGDKKVIESTTADDEGDIILSEDFPRMLAAMADDSPLSLHWVMFVPNLRSLADEEQSREWLRQCRDFRMVGCYAQTELGHGSNVRAMETTATFVRDDKGGHFLIHSPTITSAKFWPGTLGRTANHAVVIARLIDGEGVDRGVHNFLVQLRSMDDHSLMEGVTTGDIGPKIGYNVMDNGWARFDKVKIPRRNMLMRFAIVDETGRYNKKSVSEATSKVAYITMMQVRSFIVDQSGINLAMACTIAIRYSAVRRQGFDKAQDKSKDSSLPTELQILDYTQQQHRLFPLLAASYAFFFEGKRLLDYLKKVEHDLVHSTGGISKTRVADLHASTSCLKSFCTMLTADGIEECRRACGGHGFLASSGLPELLGTYLQNPTVEGDNHMLPQQTVRVLLKMVQTVVAAVSGGDDDNDDLEEYRNCDSFYLVEPLKQLMKQKMLGSSVASGTFEEDNLLDLDFLLKAYRQRAARLLLEVAEDLQARTQDDEDEDNSVGKNSRFAHAWNACLVTMARVSRAHAMALLLQHFQEGIASSPDLGAPERDVFMDLARLFALYHVERDLGEFEEFVGNSKKVRSLVLRLLSKVRTNAVALVDARDFSDFRLKSALGRWDGDVYPAIMKAAEADPLNDTERGPGYQHLQRLYVDGVGAYTGTVARL